MTTEMKKLVQSAEKRGWIVLDNWKNKRVMSEQEVRDVISSGNWRIIFSSRLSEYDAICLTPSLETIRLALQKCDDKVAFFDGLKSMYVTDNNKEFHHLFTEEVVNNPNILCVLSDKQIKKYLDKFLNGKLKADWKLDEPVHTGCEVFDQQIERIVSPIDIDCALRKLPEDVLAKFDVKQVVTSVLNKYFYVQSNNKLFENFPFCGNEDTYCTRDFMTSLCMVDDAGFEMLRVFLERQGVLQWDKTSFPTQKVHEALDIAHSVLNFSLEYVKTKQRVKLFAKSLKFLSENGLANQIEKLVRHHAYHFSNDYDVLKPYLSDELFSTFTLIMNDVISKHKRRCKRHPLFDGADLFDEDEIDDEFGFMGLPADVLAMRRDTKLLTKISESGTVLQRLFVNDFLSCFGTRGGKLCNRMNSAKLETVNVLRFKPEDKATFLQVVCELSALPMLKHFIMIVLESLPEVQFGDEHISTQEVVEYCQSHGNRNLIMFPSCQQYFSKDELLDYALNNGVDGKCTRLEYDDYATARKLVDNNPKVLDLCLFVGKQHFFEAHLEHLQGMATISEQECDLTFKWAEATNKIPDLVDFSAKNVDFLNYLFKNGEKGLHILHHGRCANHFYELKNKLEELAQAKQEIH